MNIDFTKLQIFYYLAIFKDYQKVGEHLKVSIGKVKFAIAQLEKKHSTRLFQRDGKVQITSFRLTADGLAMFDNLRSVFKDFPFKQESDLFGLYQQKKDEKIEIYTTYGIMKFLLNGFVDFFDEKSLKKISLNQIQSANYIDDVYSLKENLPDVFISDKKIENKSFYNKKIGSIGFSFYTTQEYLDNNPDSFSSNECHFYIFSTNELSRLHAFHYLDRVSYIQNFDFLHEICMASKGIVMLPDIFMGKSLVNVLPEMHFSVDVYLSYNKSKEDKPLFGKIIGYLQKNIESILKKSGER